MSAATTSISIPVDLTNPGQFFACCGLFELADRLWPGAEGWFEIAGPSSIFHISASTQESRKRRNNEGDAACLRMTLCSAASIRFDVGSTKEDGKEGDDSEDESSRLSPIVVTSPFQLVLDWWSDKSLKPWAGSMKERLILNAMLREIDSANPDPMNDAKAVTDPPTPAETGKGAKKPKKREPFYFDCRRGSNAHPLDSGFSPDVHHWASICFPVVEAMCFIGLQRCRPAPTDTPNRSVYTAWGKSLPVNAIGPIVCGLVDVPASVSFTFDNLFRTDQKKHKSYSRASAIRSKNV